MKVSPADRVPVTGPVGAAQLMLSADTVLVKPMLNAGVLITENSGRLAQLTALKASSLRPEIVLPVIDALGSPPDRMRFLIARQSRVQSWALSRAARPATCGSTSRCRWRWRS